MSGFEREVHVVGGVKTVLYAAGRGEPLLFLHGGVVLGGHGFAAPWTGRYRVIAPHHPGFGESDDEPGYTRLDDYVMHYLELLDALGLERVDLVGLSLGGQIAAMLASQHGHRVGRLALITPLGMTDPHNPATDLLAVPGDQIAPMLVSDPDVLGRSLPDDPGPDLLAGRYRESATLARLFWEQPHDPRFMRYLHRIKAPTMILWGDEDKIVPVQQSELWRKLVPAAEIRVYQGAGHYLHLERPEAVEAIARFLG